MNKENIINYLVDVKGYSEEDALEIFENAQDDYGNSYLEDMFTAEEIKEAMEFNNLI